MICYFLTMVSSRRLAVIALISSVALNDFSSVAEAQTGSCIRVDRIAKWEILNSYKTLVYDAQGNSIAFIDFAPGSTPDLRKGTPTFRFFSPSICVADDVQINGNTMSWVNGIKLVRKQ